MKNLVSSAIIIAFLALILGICSTVSAASQNDSASSDIKIITDMRGLDVAIPKDPMRVAILDKGHILQTMVAMGVQDKLVATGGLLSIGDKNSTDRDTLFLYPELLEIPDWGYPLGGFNLEALAATNPDVVIWMQSEYINDSQEGAKAMDTIENKFKIPLVVIRGSGTYEDPSMDVHYQNIMILGEVFGKKDRAREIIDYMKKQIDLIQSRTANIPDSEKPSVMIVGLRNETTGVVWGSNWGDAKFSEEVAHIKNVFEEHSRTLMSAEQIIELNPDVIVLATNTVTPYPDILYDDPAYESMRNITAVLNKRVTSIGLLTWWGDFRLELPTILMIEAKSAYPDKLADIDVYDWLAEYHMNLYGLDRAQAEELANIQKLTWMKEKGF